MHGFDARLLRERRDAIHRLSDFDASYFGARPEMDPEPLRVLVGGFDPEMRKELIEKFAAAGYEAAEAVDRTDLVSHIERTYLPGVWEQGYDLVVIDARGSEIGLFHPLAALFHTLRVIRRAGWETPVLLIGSRGDEVVAAAAREIGADLAFDTNALLRATWQTLFLMD